MIKEPKKFIEIARVCEVLSKTAVTSAERNSFAALALKWRKFAADREANVIPLSDLKQDSSPRALPKKIDQ